MPNHVENILRVTGPAADVDRFELANEGHTAAYRMDRFKREQLRKTDPTSTKTHNEAKSSVFTFNALVPVPQDVLDAGFNDAGYDWQRIHWGTKWDAYRGPQRVPVRNGVLYTFTTAWSVPAAWLRVAVELFPMLEFELFARDEYPWAMTILAQGGDGGNAQWEVCRGESVTETEEV